MALGKDQVRLALAYYAESPEDIDAEIRDNEHAARRARAAWEAQQRVIG